MLHSESGAYFGTRHRRAGGGRRQPSGRALYLEHGQVGGAGPPRLSLGVPLRLRLRLRRGLRLRLRRGPGFLRLAISAPAWPEARWLDRSGRCGAFPARKGPSQALHLLQARAPQPPRPGLHRLVVGALPTVRLQRLRAGLRLVPRAQGLRRPLEGSGWDVSLLLRVGDKR